ncbi:MAG: lipopolysaccharide heptosyltransferase II [Candidatus Aminicenantales bacterium]
MKIVVRTPNWIGDALMAMPAMAALRRHHAADEIWIAAPAGIRDIFAGLETRGRLFLPGAAPQHASLRHAAAAWRAGRFDAGLLLTNSFSSALEFALARIPQRWGYDRDGRGLLLTTRVRYRRPDKPVHMVRYYLDLMDGLGMASAAPEIRLRATPEEIGRGRDLLAAAGIDSSRPLAVLSPGAAFGPAKRWPAERFAELAALLQNRHGVEIAVTGTAHDREAAAVIGAGLSHPAADLTGKTTLRELFGVIAAAAVFVTNDSGPMHLANALRVPVVALFGPTDPVVTAPFHEPRTILKKEVACWPCLYRRCPYDHRCLAGISAEEAADAAGGYL